MRRAGLLSLATASVAALAFACGGSKPPPPPVAGLDAAAEVPADAEAPPPDTGLAEVPQDAGTPVEEEDAGFDPGLTRRDASLAYPAGPFGTAVGDIVPNIRLYGYPKGSASDPSNTWRELNLAQLWDPQGNQGPNGAARKTLFVNVSARWCSFCKLEAATQNDTCKAKADQGLVCYTSIFQNSVGGPATRDDVNYWMTTYGLEMPITVDPAFQWGIFFSEEGTPLNLFVDLKTMRIAGYCLGADEQCIAQSLDDFTRCPTAVCPQGQVCRADGTCGPK